MGWGLDFSSYLPYYSLSLKCFYFLINMPIFSLKISK